MPYFQFLLMNWHYVSTPFASIQNVVLIHSNQYLTQGVKGHGLRPSIKGSSKLFKVPFTALCIHIPIIQILFRWLTGFWMEKNAHTKLFIWNRGQKSRSKVLKCVIALSLAEKYIYSFLCIMSILICLWWRKKITVGQSNMHPNTNIWPWGRSSR